MKMGFYYQGCLGNYRAEAWLGEGAYGQVYRVRGPTGRAFAVKVLDVYALGIVLWELIYGERHEVPARPPALGDLGTELMPVGELYRRMTADNPDERPTAQEVATVCDRMLAWMARGDEVADEPWWETGFKILGVATAATIVVVGAVAAIDAMANPRRR